MFPIDTKKNFPMFSADYVWEFVWSYVQSLLLAQ